MNKWIRATALGALFWLGGYVVTGNEVSLLVGCLVFYIDVEVRNAQPEKR